MKTQYLKWIFTGFLSVVFVCGIGFYPVYAASLNDGPVKAPRTLKQASDVKKKSRMDAGTVEKIPESEAVDDDKGNEASEEREPSQAEEKSDVVAPARRGGSVSSGNGDLQEKSTQSDKLIFNFDNAELSEVIRTLADLLNINYMLDKGVSGKVTIHTAGELSREDLFPVFYQVLEINGVTAVKDKNIYKIVPLKDVSRMQIISRTKQTGSIPTAERMIIQVIPLDFVSAQEMSKVLAPFISQDGTIVSQDNRNILVIVDKSDNISKVLRLVKVFDTDVFERVNHRFFPLSYSDVETIVDIMDKLFASYGDAIKADIHFIPLTRLNTLLVASPNPKAFDAVESFIKQYDVPSQDTEPGIYVYPLKNGRAEDIANILSKVFTGKTDTMDKKGADKATVYRNPLDAGALKEKMKDQSAKQEGIPTVPSPAGMDISSGSGTLRGEINITTDEFRNSLIVEATPADYQIIKNLLKQVDVMPRQVLIEVTFAEIALDDSTAMGVEWSYAKGDANLSTSLLKATMGDSGLNFTIGNPDRWTAALSALSTENKVNILSNPSIMASNSMPASIDISQEIPVASSQYQYTTGDNPLLETNIQYRDTGIMLSVTPNINELGLVTMEIDQEISEQASNVSVGGQDYPSFFKRSTTTTLTVQSGQTIVIGGLIRETKSDGVSGTPWFTNIPVLSFLFGKTSNSASKTELIILISPYVITTADDVDAVTREFSNRLKSLSLYSD